MKLKTPFYSRKNLLLLGVPVLVFYTVMCSWVVIKKHIDRNHALQAAKAQSERLANLSPIEKSILRAQNHLVDSISVVGTSERIFLSYLQRKFDLPKVLGADGPPMDLSEDPRTYPSEVHYLARIAYPNKIVKEAPKYELDDGVKITNIYSANCDHLALPVNYRQAVDQNIATGGYYLAHVALAFTFMKDNGCELPSGMEALKDQVEYGLVSLADDPATIADLRYEAVAFLLLSERRDLVKPAWIERILNEQRPKGGWSREVGENKDDAHASLLAFWSLLEYSRPDTPNQPLIRRPNG